MGATGAIKLNYLQMQNSTDAENYYTKLGKNIKLTNNQNQSLEEYKIQSSELNNGLRNNTVSHNDYRVKDIDKIINKSPLPDNVVVYRSLLKSVVGDIDSAIGKTISDKGYFSTTLNPRTMQKFLNSGLINSNIGVIVRVRQGTNALPMSAVKTKYGSSEQEILFGRNTKIKITGKTYLIADMK